jgi:uncharacterized RDD family membrane protein YckC
MTTPPSGDAGEHPMGDARQASPPTLPKTAYTSWPMRLAAGLIDWIPVALLVVVPYVYFQLAQIPCMYLHGVSASGYQFRCLPRSEILWIEIVGWALAVVFFLWNKGHREGTTGQSVGKSMLRFAVVHDTSRQPIGFRSAALRQLFNLRYSPGGFLTPLWNDERRTLADKRMGTVCMSSTQLSPPGVPTNPQYRLD